MKMIYEYDYDHSKYLIPESFEDRFDEINSFITHNDPYTPEWKEHILMLEEEFGSFLIE